MNFGLKAKIFAVVELLRLQNFVLKAIRFFLFGSVYKAPDNISHVCVHRVGQIGDMICALPAMYAIRRHYPHAKFTLLTSPGAPGNPGAKELAEALPWIDDVKVYYSNEVSSISSVTRFCRVLRKSDIDVWFALPQDLTTALTEIRNILFAKAVGVRWAGGFAVSTIRLFLTDQEKVLSFKQESEVLLERIESFGIDVRRVDHGFVVPILIEERAKDLLSREKSKVVFPLLGIAPGGNKRNTRWPVERFLEVAKLWSMKGGGVIIFGGYDDDSLGETILSDGDVNGLNLCGKINLLESMTLMRYCSVMLTNDSGPMHMSSAMGVETVVIFSARDFSKKWYPWGNKNTVFRGKYECSPCLSNECNYGGRCVTDVSVQDVWAVLGEHQKEIVKKNV